MIISDIVEMKTKMQEFIDKVREKADEDSREFYEDMEECEEKDEIMQGND